MPESLLTLAVSAAREAGRLLVDGRPTDLGVAATKSSPTDVVTEMDRAAEALLRDRLLTARPGDGMLGEEGADVVGGSGVRWIVDPIDGTVNYLYGLPHWAVSIAAERDGAVVAGVVHAPALNTTWTAAAGQPATQDGRPIRVGDCRDLPLALVATGFGYDARLRAWQAGVLQKVLPRVRDVRRAGSAAIDLCLVACGQVDGYYEAGLNAWDRAAGELIVRQAGGLVASRPVGADRAVEVVVATNPGLAGPLGELLDGAERAAHDAGREL